MGPRSQPASAYFVPSLLRPEPELPTARNLWWKPRVGYYLDIATSSRTSYRTSYRTRGKGRVLCERERRWENGCKIGPLNWIISASGSAPHFAISADLSRGTSFVVQWKTMISYYSSNVRFCGFRSIRSERPRLGISRIYWHEQPSSSGLLVHLFFHRISAISKKTRPKSTKSTHSNGRRSSTKASANWAWRRTASRTWTSSGCSSARSVSQWLKLRALFWEDIYHGVNSLPHEKNAKHF